ncbi:hypothetical protein ACXR2T_12075 [Leucobacter sp. HY1910]
MSAYELWEVAAASSAEVQALLAATAQRICRAADRVRDAVMSGDLELAKTRAAIYADALEDLHTLLDQQQP